jgi:hypothetical protein
MDSLGSEPDDFRWILSDWFPLVASRLVSLGCQPTGFSRLPAGWYFLVISLQAGVVA